MKKLLQNSGLALMLALGMSSCSKSSEWYYQVCNMQADQSWVEPGTENNTDQPFSGANADCRVEYDLWGEGGNFVYLVVKHDEGILKHILAILAR